MKFAFQYYNGGEMIADKENLSAQEAKDLWYEYQDSFEKMVERGRHDAAMCVWREGNKTPYGEEVIHIRADECLWRSGVLYRLEKAFPSPEEW